jgi:ketosteroid isomerase-like protein
MQMTDLVSADAGIRQLQSRYMDSVWRKDFTAFGDCFTEDCEWRIAGEVLRGRRHCVAFLEDVMTRFNRVFMSMQTPILQMSGGTVLGRTYVTERNSLVDGSSVLSIGIYYDRFVEQGDRWRFGWHHFQLYYLGPADLSGRFYEMLDYGAPCAMPGPNDPAVPSLADMATLA